MKCKECKTKIKEKSAEFCPFCGERIADETTGKFTDITVILDRSGSMGVVKDKTIQSFNNYLLEQKQVESKALITLCQFNQFYEVVYKNMDLQRAPNLTDRDYRPNGNTALLDAVGKTILEKDYYYNSLPKKKRPEQTLFLIITDGEENASREYNLKKIQKMIGERKNKGWQFAFIGAEIDAYQEASAMGIGSLQTYYVNTVDNFNQGWTAASNATVKYRSAGGSFLFSQNTTSDGSDVNTIDTKSTTADEKD